MIEKGSFYLNDHLDPIHSVAFLGLSFNYLIFLALASLMLAS